MISIYKLKPAFQKLLLPLLKKLHASGVSANQITWTSIVLSFFIGLAFWYSSTYNFLFLALPLGLLLRMALNALDGMMARNYNQQSKKGEILNEMGDIVSDIFIFFPLLIFEKDILFLIVLFMLLSVINEFAGIMAKVISGTRRYDGPMGKSDRAFVLGIYGIASFLAIDFKDYSLWIFMMIILLLVISTNSRIKNAIKTI